MYPLCDCLPLRGLLPYYCVIICIFVFIYHVWLHCTHLSQLTGFYMTGNIGRLWFIDSSCIARFSTQIQCLGKLLFSRINNSIHESDCSIFQTSRSNNRTYKILEVTNQEVIKLDLINSRLNFYSI